MVVPRAAAIARLNIEVATPLGNRLRAADPDVYGGLSHQPYGLLGPARLVPYGEERVRP